MYFQKRKTMPYHFNLRVSHLLVGKKRFIIKYKRTLFLNIMSWETSFKSTTRLKHTTRKLWSEDLNGATKILISKNLILLVKFGRQSIKLEQMVKKQFSGNRYV